jgi:hypothetical protein
LFLIKDPSLSLRPIIVFSPPQTFILSDGGGVVLLLVMGFLKIFGLIKK